MALHCKNSVEADTAWGSESTRKFKVVLVSAFTNTEYLEQIREVYFL